MKKKVVLMFLTLLTFTGCASVNFFQEEISIEEVIAKKETIDMIENPARQALLRHELRNKKIILKDVLVRDVTASSNIDYDLCAIADLSIGDKKVQCYLYSPSIKIISKLEKGKTHIDAEGTFDRFFSTLDNYYTKVEITKVKIRIREGNK
jgi:hypothetical protein